MGYDEHGPAYPNISDGDNYRCPVCGIQDREAFLRCSSGGCPDGRDQGYRHRYSRPKAPHWYAPPVFWASFIAWLLWLLWPHI